MLNAHPPTPVLTSMPGIGVRTAAPMLLEIGELMGYAEFWARVGPDR